MHTRPLPMLPLAIALISAPLLASEPAEPPAAPAGPSRTPIKPDAPGAVLSALPGENRSTLAPGRLVRQNAFLIQRRAAIVRQDGQTTAVFDPDQQGKAEPPMPLLPNTHLQSLERLADRGDASTRFNISGQVLAYKGRNYLLLDRPAELVRSAAPVKPAEAVELPAPGGKPEDLAKKLEDAARARESTRPVLATVTTPTTAAEKLTREGTFITDRRGRVLRQPTGEWAVNFDADATGKSEQPMILLPSLNLQNMERLAELGGEASTMSLSGVVTTYRGRNYLLPTLYRLNRRTEIVPGQ